MKTILLLLSSLLVSSFCDSNIIWKGSSTFQNVEPYSTVLTFDKIYDKVGRNITNNFNGTVFRPPAYGIYNVAFNAIAFLPVVNYRVTLVYSIISTDITEVHVDTVKHYKTYNSIPEGMVESISVSGNVIGYPKGYIYILASPVQTTMLQRTSFSGYYVGSF